MMGDFFSTGVWLLGGGRVGSLAWSVCSPLKNTTGVKGLRVQYCTVVCTLGT